MNSIIKYVVKDLISNEYMKWGGRGDRSYSINTTPHLEDASHYNGRGPATAFINQYLKLISKPHTVNKNNPLPIYDLQVIEIEVIYKET